MLLERGGIMQNLVAVAGNGLLDRRAFLRGGAALAAADRKSTRLNSSHSQISYAVFCLKKKKRTMLKVHYMFGEHATRTKTQHCSPPPLEPSDAYAVSVLCLECIRVHILHASVTSVCLY